MKKYQKIQYIISVILLLISTNLFAQDDDVHPFFNNTYLSVEANYRSYGTNDHTGIGVGIEASKDIKKWLGIGVNLSYWNNERLDWDFVNPFTGESYKYYGKITEYKIAPFAQFIPINTKYFDFYIQTGIKTGYYYQNYYLGGYNTSYNPESFDVFIYDEGNKGISFGYELGFALRFQFKNIILVPSTIFSNDINGDGFNSLNLKIGWYIN